MIDVARLEQAIMQQLSGVIDPETGVDVVRMHLIEDLVISEGGEVAYTFRPSSYFCPLAVSLSMEILRAVSEVEGVTRQKVAVEDYLQADALVKLLDEVQDDKPGT